MDGSNMTTFLNHISQMNVEDRISNLEDIPHDVNYLLTKSTELLKLRRFEECIESVQAVLDVTWEQLNTGHWSLVPESQRSVYATASLLKVKALVCQLLQSTERVLACSLETAVKTADMGLLLGNTHREQLTLAAKLLSQAMNSENPRLDTLDSTDLESTSSEGILQVPTQPVYQLNCPSLETFSADHFYPRLPLKITGCMSEWTALRRWSDLNYLVERAGSRTVPVELGSSYSDTDSCMSEWTALRRWSDLNYLVEKAGSRTVPVELGSSYSDSEWSQKLMTLREFVTQHVNNSTTNHAEKLGYLAQHQLFDQIPELRQDICVPEYCACSDLVEGEDTDDVDINAWFGPRGTVSPLHHDPKHNLLCQVVGRKRVVLYSTSDSDSLYPHEGRLLGNTARVDPEHPDFKQFPRFRDTQAYVCTLAPGEMLYIPPHWWHHVRSLDVSFSVSFWWS